MITIKNVKTLDDQVVDHTIASSKDYTIEAGGKLLLLPGMIDPHICFGSIEEKSADWESAVSSAIRGGITTAIEIPSDSMPLTNKESLEKKRKLIDTSLSNLQAPLHYDFYAQGDPKEVEGVGLLKKLVKGIVIKPDSNKKERLDDEWDRVFQMAAWENLPIVVNAYNENTQAGAYADGSETLIEKAIYYAEKQSTRLYILNVATQQEIDLIQEARKRAVLIYAETTPQHLFQQDASKADCLWKALNGGIIETIGSGYHADHQSQEKILFRGINFSFLNPLFLLPLLLTARAEGKISIEKIARLIRYNVHEIFEIERTHDAVLINLEKEETVQRTDGKNSATMVLKGWPIYTIVQGQIFSSPESAMI